MKHESITILRYISILQRNTNRYFDLTLEPDQIGSGQQFFLLRIAEHEGIAMYDLARLGHFDKGTVTKAVQKLSELGYVYLEPDLRDRRVRHLYVTERARPLIERVYHLRDHWTDALTRALPAETQEQLLHTLQILAERSCQTLEEMQSPDP